MIFSSSRCLLLSLCAVAVAAHAQPPMATPTPAPKPKEGYIRLWNMLPKEAGEVAVQVDTGSGEPQIIAAGPPGNFSAGYVPVKPGRYPIKIVRMDDPKTPLKSVDLVMRADVYVTFLAQAKDGALSIEMLDDTVARSPETPGKLTIRHFLPGAKVTISRKGTAPIGPLGDGAVQVVDNLPARAEVFKLKAVLPDGNTREWTTEVDFKTCRHVSMLLALDPYGRFRPRTAPDGQPEFTDPEAALVPATPTLRR